MTWRGSRGRSLVALGFFLARRGVTAAVAAALTLAVVAGFGALAVFFAHGGRPAAVPDVPILASSALAFGVGILVAFAASTRVFRRDEDDGVRALLRARGATPVDYLVARVAGLAGLLATLVGGGSLLVGLVALLASRGRIIALHTVQASFAAAAFGVAFAVTFAVVAVAALGARSRGGGYLVLLAVLVVPDLLRPALERFISPAWLEVCSVSGALLALRTSLAPVGVDLPMLGRALAALATFIAAGLLVVRIELRRSHASRRPRARQEPGRPARVEHPERAHGRV